ncbi:hypothetical protein CCHOA_10920 [Corynebacterium choanae]|uniref:Uncharacterized protein n=1 Tax=Corynebacterium choanae TaxID=1862358 RepID=A0A3G6J9U8_9CORY|nr:hypothetical protein CCHOA_10920 [Corynebacterium choanae]
MFAFIAFVVPIALAVFAMQMERFEKKLTA